MREVMADGKKHVIKRSISGLIRSAFVAIGLLLQIAVIVVLVYFLQSYATYMYLFLEILGLILVFGLVNEAESYKRFWIVIILVLPVMGYILYAMWGRKRTNTKKYRKYRNIEKKVRELLPEDNLILKELKEVHPNKVQISRFLSNEGFPAYTNTQVTYFPLGEYYKEALLKDLENAQKYIFMSYFIVSDGNFWQQVYSILKRKVREGVTVRLLLDDFGCIIINTRAFRRDLKANGIDLAIFAPIHKEISSLSCNYRSHEKITIVDGNVGYTGGINIADEYSNEIVRFGHWKDSGVRLEGEAVYSLTCFFLEMWQMTKKLETIDYSQYAPTIKKECTGLVQPFADGPANNPRNPAEGTFTHLINKARDYIYITTPYLVLDEQMKADLQRAARSGVDVRIITPRMYDKRYVYMVTVSNYGDLLREGVKIYEYTPGFIHAKNAISDDEVAICSTVNMDYRSFYLHYECGVLMNGLEQIAEMKQDFMDTLKQCEEIHLENWEKRPIRQKVLQTILKIFSPLM